MNKAKDKAIDRQGRVPVHVSLFIFIYLLSVWDIMGRGYE
jgi:hypothetical protein